MAWSKRPEVQDAWVRLAERHGLEVDAFEKGTWMFLGIVLGRNYDIVISMSKARRLGWTGYTPRLLSACCLHSANSAQVQRYLGGV